MENKQLSNEETRNAIFAGLRAAGIESAYGMIKTSDGRAILLDMDTPILEAAGMVKFLETKISIAMLELLQPKPVVTTDTPAPRPQARAPRSRKR